MRWKQDASTISDLEALQARRCRFPLCARADDARLDLPGRNCMRHWQDGCSNSAARRSPPGEDVKAYEAHRLIFEAVRRTRPRPGGAHHAALICGSMTHHYTDIIGPGRMNGSVIIEDFRLESDARGRTRPASIDARCTRFRRRTAPAVVASTSSSPAGRAGAHSAL